MHKVTIRFWFLISVFMLCQFGVFINAEAQQVVRGCVPAGILRLGLSPMERLNQTKVLHLAIMLPLRNQDALNTLLRQLYDPTSPNYHQYLTPEQFTSRFGPTRQDYQAVMTFAKENGLTIVGTHSDNMLLDVSGTVTAIEKALNVKLNVYRHPTENRTFFAPDVEPTLNLSVPILHISGLDNYYAPRPRIKNFGRVTNTQNARSGTGSGMGGSFTATDLRAAYLPNVTLNGQGQTVGLVEFDGFNSSDVNAYAYNEGLPYPSLSTVLVDGFNGIPIPWGPFKDSSYMAEVALDIEMVMAMAPNAKITVYEESPDSDNSTATAWDDMLAAMANNTAIKQFSCSWGAPYEGVYNNQGQFLYNPYDQYLQKMISQGQSFFAASGDDDGLYPGQMVFPNDDPYLTDVGGTCLTTSGPGGSYVSESVWNYGEKGSTGGTSSAYAIPYWQEGVSMVQNGGSSNRRNTPDVALTASNIYFYYCHDDTGGGTSFAAPLWAGFAALVNQQAAASGDPPVGFVNPAIYSLGESSFYSSVFHDVTSGNNNLFNAEPGFDLCTGWGSPKGQPIINDLINMTIWGTNGNKTITENSTYTIPSGKVLAIMPGTTVQFTSAAWLTVNGTLIAVGGTDWSDPITFTFPGAGGIYFNGSGANGSILSGIYESQGDVEIYNCSNITVENSMLDTPPNYGIYAYNANGTIQGNIVVNALSSLKFYAASFNCFQNQVYRNKSQGSSAGVVCQGGSGGNFWQNDIRNFRYGVEAVSSSSPWLYWNPFNPPYMNNRITGCYYGVYATGSSWPSLGGPESDEGFNSLYGNTWNIYFTSGPPALSAYQNYWGVYPNPSGTFMLGSGSSVIYTNPLPTDPWTGIPLPSVQSKGVANASTSESVSSANSLDRTLTATNSESVSSSPVDPLLQGVELRANGKFNEAKDFFMSYLDRHPENQAAYVDLYNCANSETTPDLIRYFKSLSRQAGNEQVILLSYLYLKQGQIDSAKGVNSDIITYNPNTSLAARAELNAFYIALYNENNPSSASTILKQIESQASLLTPLELSDAQTALKNYVDPKTGTMPNFQSTEELDPVELQANELGQNYPNPFNPTTKIAYDLSKGGYVTLKVYDVLGREVAKLVNEDQGIGIHFANFDGSRFASGVYFYRLTAPGINQVKKMLLTK
ncbi:MAG TPA: protease pro-enzyme activation domain-containing protein [Candidatus Acidoferrales bacterium]|nr:protease pro-enzyme activation domain-containing protein [Candidatus Acidoferrales bacterium]